MEYIFEKLKDGKIKKRKAHLDVCIFCKKSYLKPLRFKKQKFCSKICFSNYSKKSYIEICSFCKKHFEKKQNSIKNSKSKLFFCSRNCKDNAQKIENGISSIWPNHYNSNKSYKLKSLYLKKLNSKCSDCGVDKEYLLSIHHIDGDRNNNNLNNLILLCFNCHAKRHLKKNKNKKWILDFKSITPTEKLNIL